MNPHIFAGNPFDRGDVQRRDQDWLDTRAVDPHSRFLPLWNLNILVQDASQLQLGWLSPETLADVAPASQPIFLGLLDDVAHFAINISEIEEPLQALQLAPSWRFEDARSAAVQLSLNEGGIVAQSRAQLDWHRRHQFCSVCGQPTTQGRGGQVRACGSCKAQHFPRTDPVVIMVVCNGEECLLGQSRGRMSRTGRYSALAGFMDQGEAIEEAVRREVKEEAGIEVGEVRYHSSQPWPFPSSLMIGCHAQALTTDIHMDNEEMADVRWFSRDDVHLALQGTNQNLQIPDRIAIAHHLIKAWAQGEVDWD